MNSAIAVAVGTLADRPGTSSAVALSIAILIFLISLMWERTQRRASWAAVLAYARSWAASVGGELKRVSEQPAVHGYRRCLVARRYRVTFIDGGGAECVATLRFTMADRNWSIEKLIRDMPVDAESGSSPPGEEEFSAEGYARRHRGKIAGVSVIFAPPMQKKPPVRST